MNLRLLSGIATVLVHAAAPAPAQQRDLLDRAVTTWTKVRTARATFEQTIANPLTGSTLAATGTYQQQRQASSR